MRLASKFVAALALSTLLVSGTPLVSVAATSSARPAATVKKTLKKPASKKSAIVSSKTNCTIKGNVSAKKEKIFHVLGCPNYSQTVIDSSAGERLFCSEKEALIAGWRKALNCK